MPNDRNMSQEAKEALIAQALTTPGGRTLCALFEK